MTRALARRLDKAPPARARRARQAAPRIPREELARSHRCFFGPDPSYHEARRRFVYKLGAVTRQDGAGVQTTARAAEQAA